MGSWGKKIKKKNGTNEVFLYGLQGRFRVKNQKYILEDGRSTDYLQLCNSSNWQHYSASMFVYRDLVRRIELSESEYLIDTNDW